MSWLQPTERDTDYFAQLQADEHEQLCRYAQVLAMAARIDPHLLRSLRLRFLPDSSAELELALWFCDVISSRNATGADMYPGVARLLCDELRVDAGRYRQVKGAVKQLTQHWRAAELLEQTMRWAVLEEDADTLQQSYQRILHQLHVTSGAFEKREIARWAKGALATTLDKEQPLQEATWLYQYVVAALGSPGQWLEKRDVAPLPDELRLALPEGRLQRIGIRVYPGVLQFVKPDEGDLDVIEVDLPIPTSVQIRFNDGEPKWDVIWYGRTLKKMEGNNKIALRALNGQMFDLEILQKRKPVRVFVSYASADVEYLRMLRVALSPLERIYGDNLIIWDDRSIENSSGGWQEEILHVIEKSDVFLPLISSDFVSSYFLYNKEISAVLGKNKIVTPIILRKCYWENLPISKFQATPKKWLNSYKDKDLAWAKVTKDIDNIVRRLLSDKKIESLNEEISTINYEITNHKKSLRRKSKHKELIDWLSDSKGDLVEVIFSTVKLRRGLPKEIDVSDERKIKLHMKHLVEWIDVAIYQEKISPMDLTWGNADLETPILQIILEILPYLIPDKISAESKVYFQNLVREFSKALSFRDRKL